MEAPNLNYVRALSGGDKLFENKLITIIKREFKRREGNLLQQFHSRKICARIRKCT